MLDVSLCPGGSHSTGGLLAPTANSPASSGTQLSPSGRWTEHTRFHSDPHTPHPRPTPGSGGHTPETDKTPQFAPCPSMLSHPPHCSTLARKPQSRLPRVLSSQASGACLCN